MTYPLRWHATSAEETEAAGARIARVRPGGNPLSVVYLVGDLGAGKTTLARGFLRECGVSTTVRSPTYTLQEVYETPGLSVLHLDLYRLNDPRELDNLGLREWARSGCAWLVEWPERGAARLPPADLLLALRADPASHQIEAQAGTPLGEAWLARLRPGP